MNSVVPRFSRDEQTGKLFQLVREKPGDVFIAIVSCLYLLIALGFLLWLLFDTWTRTFKFIHWLGYMTPAIEVRLNTPIYRSFAYVFIGGGLGGVIAGYRSFTHWHSELQAFGRRFLWKYIFFPWLGATLALFVYAIIGGGISVIAGADIFSATSPNVTKMFAALAIGSLVGYGSPQVVRWLDSQVNKLFKVENGKQPTPKVRVPDLTGITPNEAEYAVSGVALKLEPSTATEHERVAGQSPSAGSLVAVGTSVKILTAAADEPAGQAAPAAADGQPRNAAE